MNPETLLTNIESKLIDLNAWLETHAIAFNLGLEFLSLLILAPLTAQFVQWRENRRWQPFRADVLARMRDACFELSSRYSALKEDLFAFAEAEPPVNTAGGSFNESFRATTADEAQRDEIDLRKRHEETSFAGYGIPPITFRGYVYPALRGDFENLADHPENLLGSCEALKVTLETLLTTLQNTFDREGFGLAPEMVAPLIRLRRNCVIFLARVMYLEFCLLDLCGEPGKASDRITEMDDYLQNTDVNIQKIDTEDEASFQDNDLSMESDDFRWLFIFPKIERAFESVLTYNKQPRKARAKRIWHKLKPTQFEAYRVYRALCLLKIAHARYELCRDNRGL